MRAIHGCGVMAVLLIGCGTVGGGAPPAVRATPLADMVQSGWVAGTDGPLRAVASAALLSNGDLVVSDLELQRIVRFSAADASILWEADMSSSGPLDAPVIGLLAVRNDTIFVRDAGRGMVARVTSDGDVLGARRFPRVVGFPPILPAVPLPAANGGWITVAETELEPGPTGDSNLHFLLADDQYQRIDTVFTVRRTRTRLIVMDGTGERGIVGDQPLHQALLYAVDPHGEHITVAMPPEVTLNEQRRVRVLRVTITGDTVLDRILEPPPEDVPDGYLDGALREILERRRLAERFGSEERAWQALLEGTERLETLPLFRSLRLGDEGDIWLLRTPRFPGDFRWLVLNSDGDERWRVDPPSGAGLLWPGDGHAWLWFPGHDGLEPRIELYRWTGGPTIEAGGR